jgi:hypothetical protein
MKPQTICKTGFSTKLAVRTIIGTVENCDPDDTLQVAGAKGGTRTPTVLPARS